MYNNSWDRAHRGFEMMGAWGGGPQWMMEYWPLLAVALAPIILAVILWSVAWKGLALWHSGRRGQYWWFIILLVVNTMGILEIIYLFAIAKLKLNELFSTKEHHPHQ